MFYPCDILCKKNESFILFTWRVFYNNVDISNTTHQAMQYLIALKDERHGKAKSEVLEEEGLSQSVSIA